MDKKLKAKWIAALRSGKYPQAQGVLKNDAGGYCCLGVLCTIKRIPQSSIVNRKSHGWNYLHGDLPLDQVKRLAEMNDYGRSFRQIATYIEANL